MSYPPTAANEAMESANVQLESTGVEEESDPRTQPRKQRRLACGSRVCLRCHRDCGVIMAAYLGVDFSEDDVVVKD